MICGMLFSDCLLTLLEVYDLFGWFMSTLVVWWFVIELGCS